MQAEITEVLDLENLELYGIIDTIDYVHGIGNLTCARRNGWGVSVVTLPSLSEMYKWRKNGER